MNRNISFEHIPQFGVLMDTLQECDLCGCKCDKGFRFCPTCHTCLGCL